MKINEILEKVGKDIMSDETKKAITDSFNSAVDALVTERVEIAVKNAVQKIDEVHSEKLQKLLDTIDDVHTSKLEDLVKKIDENHTNKLKAVVTKYETMLKEEADGFKETMVNEVSNFVDAYLEQAVPQKQIAEAVENLSAKNTIEKLRNVLAVDDEFVTKQVSSALTDAKNVVDSTKNELNEAMKENIRLSQEFKKASSALLLEKKTSGLPDKKRSYITRLLSDKTPAEIEENFQYVIEMFEREEKEKAEVITEEAKVASVSKTVDTPKSVITEEVTDSRNNATPVDTGVPEYLSALKKFDKK